MMMQVKLIFAAATISPVLSLSLSLSPCAGKGVSKGCVESRLAFMCSICPSARVPMISVLHTDESS